MTRPRSDGWRPSKPLAYGFGLFFVALIAVIDYETGTAVLVPLFYLIPVFAASWWAGQTVGLLFSALCVAMFLLLDVYGARGSLDSAAPGWTAALTGAIYGLVSILVPRIRRGQSEEREAARFQADMLGFVVQEFGNSVSTMSMALTLLRQGEAEPPGERRRKLYDSLEWINGNIRRAVHNCVMYLQLESGTFALRPQRVSLEEIIAKELAAVEAGIREKGLRVALDLSDDSPPAKADANGLALVVANLLANAVKYSPQGGTVTVRASRDQAKGSGEERVRVEVSDEGPGLSAEDWERILSEGYRKPSAIEVAKGFGLGLKVVRRLLEKQGGALELDRRPGKGARVCFKLPAWTE